VSTIHLHLTVQQLESGKHVGTIRRDDPGMPSALQRPHDTFNEAAEWLLAQAKTELSTSHGDEAA
jgi:hypothetical protein